MAKKFSSRENTKTIKNLLNFSYYKIQLLAKKNSKIPADFLSFHSPTLTPTQKGLKKPFNLVYFCLQSTLPS